MQSPYDDILTYRESALPGFGGRQVEALNALSRILRENSFEELWDLGCGSGELLAGLAVRNRERRFIGIDNSRDSLKVARLRAKELLNLTYRFGSLSAVSPTRNDAVICTGNTAVHFGAHRIQQWLRQRGTHGKLPRWIFLDFHHELDFLVNSPDTFRVEACGVDDDVSLSLSGLNTVRSGRFIVRQLVLVRCNLMNISGANARVTSVRQYADPVCAYDQVLMEAGFSLAERLDYVHGYGQMEGRLWTRRNDL